ncbi:MAG: chain-length determining protein [Rhizobiales bacterium]|nr:chain-length determining protein [Hyphomicrobiales bacterium]
MSLEQEGSVRKVNDGATAAARALEGISLGDLAGILVRRKAWIFGTAVACVVLAAGYLAVAKPTYTSTAEVYVDPRDRPIPKEDPSERSNVPGDGILLVESQLKIITSGEVLSRVVDRMNLLQDPEFNGRSGFIANIKAMFGFGGSDNPRLAALRRLRQATSVRRNERSYVIDISVSAHAPQRAADLANAVANAYLEEQADANAGFNRRISSAITSQLERMRDAVSHSEQAVAAYKVANNLVGSRDKLVTDQELTEANTQLTNAKARLNEAQARVKLIDSIESGGAPLESLPEAIQSNTIVQLRARAVDASRTEVQLARVLGSNHPALQQARAEVQDVQSAIKSEVKRIAQSVRNVAASERINVQNLQTRFNSLKALTQTNEKAMVQLRELELKANSDRAVYETYLAKAKAATEEQSINSTNIRLISRAILPEQRSWPRTIPLIGGALFGGIFFGVMLALLRSALDQFVRTPPKPSAERTEQSLSHAVEIPAVGRRDELSRLKAEFMAASADHSILLVRTSNEEALRLVALELARAVDECGQKAVVIDADLKNSTVSSRLRFDRRLGVRDILAGRASFREAAHALGQTAIKVIPVGVATLAPLNQQMRNAFLAALRQAREFGRVIIDGGELSMTRSELGLYALADEVIFLEPLHDDRLSDVSMFVELLRHNAIKAKVVSIDTTSQAMAA